MIVSFVSLSKLCLCLDDQNCSTCFWSRPLLSCVESSKNGSRALRLLNTDKKCSSIRSSAFTEDGIIPDLIRIEMKTGNTFISKTIQWIRNFRVFSKTTWSWFLNPTNNITFTVASFRCFIKMTRSQWKESMIKRNSKML